MSVVRETPLAHRAGYIDGLKRAFNGWGDDALFKWCFERDSGAGPATFLTGWVDGELVAGSAVVWRQLDLEGAREKIGIMSGSWTLPAARGKGFFSQMIETSLQICREEGATRLLAFVTEDNASRRRLEAAGSQMIPSNYCKTMVTGAGPMPTQTDADPGEVYARYVASRSSHGHFAYPEQAQWAQSMLYRRQPVQVFDAAGVPVIVEVREEYSMVLCVAADAPARRRAALTAIRCMASEEKPVLTYAMDRGELDDAWQVLPGFITALPVDGTVPAIGIGLRIENGDRI
jgi:GNAT superfamily N-acetyltransferase